MQVIPVKTHQIIPGQDSDILGVLDKYITRLDEKSVVLVTSKIVSICAGRFVKMDGADKDSLIALESDQYLPRSRSKYNVTVTIAQGILGAGAGIDESNGNGYYILWPEDSQREANRIRHHLQRKFDVGNVGVVITDSRTSPLRWGVTGVSLAHSGFLALKDYIGTPDIFGRTFQFEKLNIADCLATAGVLAMGEGSEQTPIAVARDIPTIEFQDRDPTAQELSDLMIDLEDDMYGEFLTSASWIPGEKRRK